MLVLSPVQSIVSGSSAAIARPTFSRDFAGEKTLNNGTGPAITFTRASNATFFDANGTLQTAANDTPRFDHSGGSSLGLLIEEARTNLLERSAEFDNAYWSKTRGTITANDQVSPDGGTNADKLVCNSTSANGAHANRSSITFASGVVLTASAFFKKGHDDWACIVVGDGSGNSFRRWFNLSTGAVGTSGALGSGWANSSASITNVGGGWYRCVSSVTTTGTTAQVIYFPSVGGDGTFGCTDAVTFGFIWGAQLEQGAFPTSYIPTTTAAATRAADSAVVTPISSFYNQAEGTLFAEVQRDTLDTALSTIASLDDGTINNRFALHLSGGTGRRLRVTVGVAAATQWDALNAGESSVWPMRVAAAYKASDFAATAQGNTAVTQASGTVPTATQLFVGQRGATTGGGAAIFRGHIRKIAYWPKRLTNTLLEQLTT